MCVFPWRAWAFYLCKPKNYQSYWCTTACNKLSECIKDRIRLDGGVSLMSSGRNLDFILYMYHLGYARLDCNNKQPPKF